MTYLYIYLAILWGVFAFEINTKIRPDAGWQTHILCGVVNCVCFPVAITVALVNLTTGKHDKYLNT